MKHTPKLGNLTEDHFDFSPVVVTTEFRGARKYSNAFWQAEEGFYVVYTLRDGNFIFDISDVATIIGPDGPKEIGNGS